MGARKRNKAKAYFAFESLSNSADHKFNCNGKLVTDTTANINYSLLTSPAFKDLSARQRMLYVCAKSEFYGARSRPKNDFTDNEEFKKDGAGMFYLNHRLVTDVYGLYPKTNRRDFYKDIEALIDHGFIQLVSSGRVNKQRSIYQYSAAWKTWGK